jgi:hypothetical protein
MQQPMVTYAEEDRLQRKAAILRLQRRHNSIYRKRKPVFIGK